MTDHIPLADAIEKLVDSRILRLRLRTGVVSSVDDGLVSIVRPGSTDPEGGYARLIPKLPEADDRVAVAQVGGSSLVLGVIAAAEVEEIDLGAPLIGQVFPRRSTAAAATTGTNTSNATFVTLRAETVNDIPDGTYDIVVDAGAALVHSGSGSVDLRVSIGAVNGTTYSLSITTAREYLRYVWLFNDVAIAGGTTITLAYKLTSGSGTITARNPGVLALFTYKGA